MWRSDVRTSEDHVYYNMTLYNPGSSTTDELAVFEECRQQPVLTNPSLYNIAVARFAISTDDIPIFNFQSGTYYVTLVYAANGNSYSTLVTHTPDDIFDQVGVYSIQNFLNDINIALLASFTALNAAHPATLITTPFMTYNPADSLYSLNVGEEYLTGYPNNIAQIWFNYPLYSRFEEFNVLFNGYGNANHQDVQFILQDTGNNVYEYTFAGAMGPISLVAMTQATSSNALVDIQTILFTTATIPVLSEQFAIQAPAMPSNTGNQSVGINILTDFVTDQSLFLTPSSAEQFVYNPTIYRLIPLIGINPLQTMTINAFWVSRDGERYPIYIAPGRSMSVKLVFIKKGFPA